MSQCRQQVLIEAPLDKVWALLVDADRHPQWWPRVVQVDCEDFSQGCTYRQVTKGPFGNFESDIMVDRLDSFREVKVRCLETGTYMIWVLTDAQGDTFVDAEFGCDPLNTQMKAFDVVAGKRYFRRWMERAVEGLRVAAQRDRATA